MATRLHGSLGSIAALIGATVLGSYPAASQQAGAAPPLVITAFGEQPAPAYTVGRTSWGEPVLQGVWSSDDTAGIPLQRQEQFGDRRYLSEQEYAERSGQVERGVERAENEATSSFRQDFARRAFWQTSLIVDPPDGRMPAYTAEGMKRPMPRGTYGNGPLDSYTDFSTYERCITRGIAGSSLRVVYGNGMRIVQAPGVVAISYEMIHDTRLLYTDGRPHLSQAIRQYLGDSRAHWEGDELVVETTNLTDRTAIGLNGNGNRHSSEMKLTERFKRVADDVIQYQTTVDDPVTYERPFTMSYPLTPLEGGKLLPYDCHEGNYALLQSLGAERAEDRALAADKAKGINRPRRPVQDGLGVGGQPISEGAGIPTR
ncbi:MAG TPA: hypothetical protein VM692_11700 [Gammaproteobacteria bacterium]|nr:hypothetical protein [Gammaproteobacteria bacterium]